MNLKKLISYTLVFAIFVFLFWNIYKNWQTVATFPWRFKLSDVVFVLVFLLPVYLINVLSWHLVTRAVGAKVKFAKNARVWVFSNLARFLPGGFWQYPGRILLLTREGTSRVVATTAVVVEMLFNLAAGSLIVILSFVFLNLPARIEGIKGILVVIVLLPILVSFLTNARVSTKAASFLARVTGKGEILRKVKLPIRWIPILTLAFFLQYFFAGASLFFLTGGVVDLPANFLPVYVGIFTASWLLGYVTVFAPAGLGVQEASIAGLLSFYMPLPIASVIAIFFRIALFVSEAVTLLAVLLFFGKRLDLPKPLSV